MGLLKNLDDATLAARKARIAKEPGGEHSAFLVWVQAEVRKPAKAELREITEADADAVLRTQVKALTTMLNGDPEKGFAPLPESPFRTETEQKRDLLDSLLPKRLSGMALADAIRQAAVDADVVIEPKAIGKIMAKLKEAYPGLIDGLAVKQMLEAGV